MKVKLTTLMLAAAALLASCSQDDGLLQNTVNTDGLTPVTLSVTLPGEGMKTRAITETEDEAVKNAYLEILVKNAEGTYVTITEGKLAGVKTMTNGGDGNFTLSDVYLDPNTGYRFLFWADNATTGAPESLTNVPYEDNSIAFAAALNWDGASRNIYATLTHVVAKVTLKTTTAVSDKSNVSLTLPETYSAYNVSEGSVAGTSGAYTFTTTAAEAVAKDAEVFSFYALLQENMQTVKIANGDYTKEVSNVPLAPNKHTVIKGDVDNIGLTSTTFMISIDDVWSNKVEKVEGLEIADDGTYIVSSAAALQAWAEAVQNDRDLNCTLAADIHLTGTNNWTPLATAYEYNGVFDGAGHTISGLSITEYNDAMGSHVGFIGRMNGGAVKNLALKSVYIKIKNTDTFNVGGLVGEANLTEISGCSVSGTIDVEAANFLYLGGIAGRARCTIAGCNVSGEIVGRSAQLYRNIGGIAGELGDYYGTAGNILGCWSTASVSGEGDHVGDIVGRIADSKIKAVYYDNSNKGTGSEAAADISDLRKVDGTSVTWETTAKDAMNTALTENGYTLQWTENTDAATKDDVPLVLEKSN